MSLLFAHRFFPASGRIWPLGGRSGRPRPVIPVAVIGPTGTWTDMALLDTGADDTVFPERVATIIGIDLSNAPAGSASGVGMVAVLIRYAEVRLRLTGGVEYREWPARVGFTSSPIKRGLLGFAGFFQFFSALFDGDRETIELTVNTLYPGT